MTSCSEELLAESTQTRCKNMGKVNETPESEPHEGMMNLQNVNTTGSEEREGERERESR
jgi:hypothetical protein